MYTYTASIASTADQSDISHRRTTSLDENDRFVSYTRGALSKIHLAYVRLLARDKLDAPREVLRRRSHKVRAVHLPGQPAARFAKRTVTRTLSL